MVETNGVEIRTRRRALRRPIVLDVEVTDQLSGIKIKDQTKDLSRFGCGVATAVPFPAGTKVTVKMILGSTQIVAFGKVMYGRPDIGMGIAFTNIAPDDQSLLEELFSD
jgi:PilZ domain-containing protein